MQKISKRKLRVGSLTLLLFVYLSGWWFQRSRQIPPVYPNSTLTDSPDNYHEVRFIEHNQLQISTFETTDSTLEVMRWLFENDWDPLIAQHLSTSRFTKDDQVLDFLLNIRHYHVLDFKATENNRTCITQIKLVTVRLFDGPVIYSTQDYSKTSGDVHHWLAISCPSETIP